MAPPPVADGCPSLVTGDTSAPSVTGCLPFPNDPLAAAFPFFPGGLAAPGVAPVPQVSAHASPTASTCPDGSLPGGGVRPPAAIANPSLHENRVAAPPHPNPSPDSHVASGAQFPQPPKTYAAAATTGTPRRPPPLFVTDLNTFHPVKRGNAAFLKMPEDLYQRRLSAFNFALIGRLFLPKNSPPRALPELKSELQRLFKNSLD